MKKCIIIAALAPDNIKQLVSLEKEDLILCADTGYDKAVAQGIVPHGIIGDFDSLNATREKIAKEIMLVSFPKEKDETDTHLCYQYGKEQGYQKFILFGGIGGRADHTYGNIQIMLNALLNKDQFSIIGKENRMQVYLPGRWLIEKIPRWTLSVFSYSPKAEEVYLTGVKYPICNGTLTWDYPLGVSNSWAEDRAELSFSKGVILVILSEDQ